MDVLIGADRVVLAICGYGNFIGRRQATSIFFEETMRNSRRNIFILAAVTLALTANLSPQASFAKAAKAKAKAAAAAKSQPQGDSETAIKGQLSSLADAAARGDGERMASFFTLDGAYVDEDGVRHEGRQSLKEHFNRHVRPDIKSALKLEPTAIRLIGNDSAWIEGSTTRQTARGKQIDARFTMLLQNKNGTWLIQSASETSVSQATAADHLADLNWLVGEWTAEQGDAKLKMSAEKVGNGHFLRLNFLLTRPGEQPRMDIQVIGWDPTRNQIVSWHFDSSGGFGYGSWSRDNNKWMIKAEGVEQSGWQSNATNVISVSNNDSFQWQSVKRNSDGVMYPDTEPLTVKRVSQ
ncbi:MAG: SgcJ/EcaC family oxidoreductase [Candidatus Obscuribacterales bacterium]|nr:SgcJ/EcaC family oxidoreductase [Candidatus Obscuribacterales bacterium]